MKTGLVGLVLGAFLAGCSSGPPSHENRELPGLELEGDFSTIHEAARDALKNAGFVIEEESGSAFKTTLAQEKGFTWALSVSLKRELGSIVVTPTLDLHRQNPFRPFRLLGQNMSDAAIDDAHLEGGNGAAYSHDRDMVEGEDDRERAEREKRIDDVARRVGVFILALETVLSKQK